MDSAALTSLTPLLDGIDRWVELAPLLPIIISLELILSADNAVALASITKSLKNKTLQNKALNIGILISLVLRILLIIFSQYLLEYKSIQFLCGLYLIFIAIRNLFPKLLKEEKELTNIEDVKNENSIFKVILLLAITDLAFSIDSITAAVSISDQILLVITGALIGVIALRFTSALFVRWLDIFKRLEFSGYIAIGFIGIKLIVEILIPTLSVPDYIVFLLMTAVLSWGFSKKET
tara:strand:+ start:3627 stop:4334 length:708 start_codon:yes stop_codon:yes gene_type:complete